MKKETFVQNGRVMCSDDMLEQARTHGVQHRHGKTYVKVCFPVRNGELNDEWMWVEVEDLEQRRGRLANEPFLVQGLSAGDPVAFEVRDGVRYAVASGPA